MIKETVKKLNLIFDKESKKVYFKTIVLSIFVSIFEIFSLMLILPFLAIASSPEIINKHEIIKNIYYFFNFSSLTQFILSLGILLVVIYLFRIILNTFFQYKITSFSNSLVAQFRNKLFEKDLKLYYTVFAKQNTSNLSNNIIIESNNIYHIVFSSLVIISEGIIFLLFMSALLFNNVQATIFLILFFGISSLIILKIFKRNFVEKGEQRTVYAQNNNRMINECFGNFKYIKLSNQQNNIYNDFSDNSLKLSKINSDYLVLMSLPRNILETLGLVTIVFTIIYLSLQDSQILVSLGVYIVAFYRLLPSANKIISSINSIKFYNQSVDIILNNLNLSSENIKKEEKINFTKKISLKNISFAYGENKVFENISLDIFKNDKIAFIGESGSGKTSIINIITTLIPDVKGDILIDGVRLNEKYIYDWRNKIGYIPQDIYLFDGTVAENIVFGQGEYNEKKVEEVLKIAKIYDFFYGKEGFHTKVGDNAIQLSGGQKQRIAIARALYKNPEILVLDEATSALDTQTEKEIMEDMYEICKDKTLLIIAHRLSTTEKCNRIIEIVKGEFNEKQI
ncbi:ABC transporter ATP-binding protein [Aliarcobacter butzleri]|uniref:ABC transporter ATP-binding protein n=1 Tax=Aliarcobacter butzleri TaxID=28197 RepID=UPI000F46D6CD|nr:ABC transporter ATP-binding protein [Aliarcobacter butzleri]